MLGELSSTGSSVGPSPGGWAPTPQTLPNESGIMAAAVDQALLWDGADLGSMGEDALLSILSNNGDSHMGYGMWTGMNGKSLTGENDGGVQDALVQVQPENKAAATQRITITVEDAEPETLTQVMDVLMRSRARVSFCRG